MEGGTLETNFFNIFNILCNFSLVFITRSCFNESILTPQ